jgi:uncharacterized phage infection (PIP) family protein YhgE
MAARQELSTMEHQLQGAIDDLDFQAFLDGNRPLTDEEKSERTQMRASQSEVRDAYTELAFVTLQRLDDSAEVAQLHARLERINRGLQDDIAALRRIAAVAETAAKVSDKVADIAAKLASKAASLGIGVSFGGNG